MGDPLDLFTTGFLTTPFDQYSGAKAPTVSSLDLKWLIAQLNNFIAQTPPDNLAETNFAYWLTYALQCAMNMYDEKAAQQICAFLYKLYNDGNPEALVSILSKTLGGTFEGQTVAYAWMDSLFTATFDSLTKADVSKLLRTADENPSSVSLDSVFF